MPNISRLMREAGLLNEEGVPTAGLSEVEIRRIAEADDWRGQRIARLEQDAPMPQEIAMQDFQLKAQAAEMLDETLKVFQQIRQNYFNTGRSTALNGAEIDLPSSSALVTLAEAGRRINESLISDSTNPVLHPQPREELSEFALEYLARLECMNTDEKLAELASIEKLTSYLNRKDCSREVYEQYAAEGALWAIESLERMNTEAELSKSTGTQVETSRITG